MAFKKILSAVMAGAMVLSLGMTAFASSTSSGITLETADPYEFTVDGTTQVPALKIVVPETVGVIANPYGLTVDATAIGGGKEVTDKIVSPVQFIKNQSAVDIDVSATVAGYVGGEVEFATTAITDSVTKKQAFVTFEMAQTVTAETAPDAYTHKAVLSAAETPVEVKQGDADKVVTMEKAGADGAVSAKGAVAFHFVGELTANDKIVTTGDNAQAPWNEEDVFGATVVFNFSAKTNAAPSSP